MPEELQPISGSIALPMTEEEFEAAGGSKFPAVGKHLSEMGMPGWKEVGRTIAFPCTITEEGPDKGKEGILYVGISKDAVWKLKEVLGALGIAYKVNKKGSPEFNPAECAGKVFDSIWTEAVDTRPADKGGKGSKYSKWTGCAKAGSASEEM